MAKRTKRLPTVPSHDSSAFDWRTVDGMQEAHTKLSTLTDAPTPHGVIWENFCDLGFTLKQGRKLRTFVLSRTRQDSAGNVTEWRFLEDGPHRHTKPVLVVIRNE